MLAVPMELEEVGEVTVVRITDKRLLDEAKVDGMRRALLRLAGDPGRSRMLLDFGAVEALSSCVLATLLSLRKRLLEFKGRLALCGLRPELCEAFALTGLEKTFNFYRSEQEALLSFPHSD